MPQLVKDFTAIDDNGSSSYNIGVLYDNVYMVDDFNSNTFTEEDNKPKTLKTFYKSIKKFFQRQMHMIYQKDEPENRGIVEWYEVTVSLEGDEQTDDPTDDNYVSIPVVPGMSSDVDKTSILNNNG